MSCDVVLSPSCTVGCFSSDDDRRWSLSTSRLSTINKQLDYRRTVARVVQPVSRPSLGEHDKKLSVAGPTASAIPAWNHQDNDMDACCLAASSQGSSCAICRASHWSSSASCGSRIATHEICDPGYTLDTSTRPTHYIHIIGKAARCGHFDRVCQISTHLSPLVLTRMTNIEVVSGVSEARGFKVASKGQKGTRVRALSQRGR